MDTDVSTDRRRIGAYVAGALVFFASAFLGASLLAGVLSLGGDLPAIAIPGHVLFSAYGFTAFLAPCLLLAASLLVIMPAKTVRPPVVLALSFIPFFTLAFGERLVRRLAVSLSGSASRGAIVGGLLVSIALAILIEYLLILLVADGIVARAKRARSGARVADTSVAGSAAPSEAEALDATIDRAIGASSSDYGESPDAESAFIADATGLSGTEGVEGVAETGEVAVAAPAEAFTAPRGTSPADRTPAQAESPTYVDFEKMRAPFDLPVVENWVDQADTAATNGSEPQAVPERPVDVAVAIATDIPGRDGIDLDSSGFVEDADAADSLGADSFDEDLKEEILDGDIIDELLESDMDDYVDSSSARALADAPISDAIPVDEAGEREFDAEEPFADIDAEDDIVDDELVDDGISDDDLSADGERGDIDLPPVVSVPPVSRADADSSAPCDPANGGAIASVAKLFKKRARVPYCVPYEILNSYPDGEYWVVDDTTRRAAAALKDTLNEFRIEADVTGIKKGPVITMFEILPAPGVKLSKIVGLQDNIALRLAASSVRIVAPIPGKHAVGIEVPNQKRAIVSFRELIETDTPQAKKMEIPVVLGKDITGEAQLLDLASTPHLLIAGSTGSGKSVCVNSIILSILYKRSPEDVKLILIDPKIVELKLYNDIAHLLAPVITESKKAFQALQYSLCEMERRYALLDGMGVRDIKSYNKRIKERNIATEKIPYIVIIIDEFADLMATTGKELESTVARLCAMSRAVGIHLVLATQRPSIDVITGLIKANIPTRIAFMVASKMDSRIIIDQVGAEKLLGKGDMLYASATDPFPVRIQGAFVSEEEVERVVEHVKTLGEPEYIDEEIFVDDDDDSGVEASLFSDGEDPLYDKALEIVLLAGKASASYIQRKLKIGYNRAARLVEDMEARGIVGPANGSKPRDVVHRP
jgi:S-DNA-T family DNA segregation ATPase FtsK/SpoIIIE